jgi:predicted RNase H-like nuclease (RuvC/YqgF family)
MNTQLFGLRRMFKKLKEMCTFKKEKQMSTTDTRTVKALKATVKEQEQKISSLRGRLADLVDEVHMLKNELQNFKQNVASDVEYLTNRVDG